MSSTLMLDIVLPLSLICGVNARELRRNDAWKILAFRWRQIFLSRYENGWVKENLEPGHVVAPPDSPSAPDFHSPYKTNQVNRFDLPPPTPHASGSK